MPYFSRKKLRLSNYDYSQNGVYFITICTKKKAKLFGNVVGGDDYIAPKIELSCIGKTVEKYVKSISGLENYVIMPNHIHLLITIDKAGPMWSSDPTTSIPQIIKTFKTLVTKELGFSVWQRSFNDRIVRNEKEYLKIWNYIDTNLQKWNLDCYYWE